MRASTIAPVILLSVTHQNVILLNIILPRYILLFILSNAIHLSECYCSESHFDKGQSAEYFSFECHSTKCKIATLLG